MTKLNIRFPKLIFYIPKLNIDFSDLRIKKSYALGKKGETIIKKI